MKTNRFQRTLWISLDIKSNTVTFQEISVKSKTEKISYNQI